ncbi:SsgA family sporulation/cell division regulator [Streptomyces sp. NPDC000151]|uniref:SsgA family sporulation/cell division regulator n=1 Tax=Streptomyces sp. NPDC000151 TaxID=3154244 RepID=UPI00331F590E
MRQTVMRREVLMDLVISPEQRVPVPAEFIYDTRDPVAVGMTVHITPQRPMTWWFARDLLAEGIHWPAGCADVRIWPACRAGHHIVCIALAGVDGHALLEASADRLRPWLTSTYQVVPRGREADRLALDDALHHLTSPYAEPARTDEARPRTARPRGFRLLARLRTLLTGKRSRPDPPRHPER